MDEVVLECRGVSKILSRTEVLKDVSITLERGEIFGLVGPNGAGKTTLMKTLLGLTKINKGNISVLGRPVKTERAYALKKIGSMIESPSFYPFFTGEQNLKYFSQSYSNITQDKIEHILDLVGMINSKNKKFKKYSLGMKQRLGIASAILHDPEILILDEPTNTLDPIVSEEFKQLILRLRKEQNLTVLISSHNLLEVEEICDRYAILSNGEVKSIDETKLVSDGTVTLRIELDNPNKAQQLLDVQFGENTEILNSSQIEFTLLRKDYSQVMFLLLSNEINITSMTEVKRGIKEHYHEAMEGGEKSV
ncbi:ABC transporter ATP-binding protein [Pontibacillus litoralis]|uniref:ABC transporter domain-containing protein n=1 Tax=Pontibacillus litoralis JSM 072002 TaxID=1385512 RepID=A0A0A5FWA5_9BACI|nr:ABC transporter ATP-binding protein [Pontibacillus litoralis]KGX85046.1 hypothetical protein N784_11160 [Pontibacillus litoralis JSM 072002]